MRIAFIGAQNVGKSTLIEEFIKQWPMYKKPTKSYRDFITESNIKLNKEGDKESQRKILDALVDELQHAVASGDKHLVFDRCPVDNIAYSLWHYAKGTKGIDEEFVINTKTIAALSLKHLDAIFYVPLREEIPLVAKENRDIDKTYRQEVDNIYKALVESYEKNTGAFFPSEDCPPLITLDGPPDMRLPQLKLYIKENGCCYGEEDGSLLDPSQI
jgi:thymidylate kinase